MTVNNTIDGTVTVRDFCTAALRKAGVTAIDDEPSDEEAQVAFDAFGAMLRTWAVEQHLWGTETVNLPLASGTKSYSVTPRILGLEAAYLVYSTGGRVPIRVVNRDQYQRLPTPDSGGVPYWCWLDRQRATTTLYTYPVPNQTGLSLDLTIKRVLFDLGSLNDEADIPPEWEECVIYSLAARICDDNGRVGPVADRLAQRAASLLSTMQGQDREDTTYIRAYRRT